MNDLFETVVIACRLSRHIGGSLCVHPGQSLIWRHRFDQAEKLEAEGFIKVWHKTPRWWRVSVTAKGWSHVES